MGCEQNLCETRVNVIHVSPFSGTIKSVNVNFPFFFCFLDKEFANFCLISREITKIMGIGRRRDFTI